MCEFCFLLLWYKICTLAAFVIEELLHGGKDKKSLFKKKR